MPCRCLSGRLRGLEQEQELEIERQREKESQRQSQSQSTSTLASGQFRIDDKNGTDAALRPPGPYAAGALQEQNNTMFK